MGLKKNSPGCSCCSSYCYDCGASGSFNEADVTISDVASVATTNFQTFTAGATRRVTQVYEGLEFCNRTVRLVADPTAPDESCVLIFRNALGDPIGYSEEFDVDWQETVYENVAGAPNQCSATSVYSSSSGTLRYALNLSEGGASASPLGTQPSGYSFPTAQDFLPFLSLSYNARACAGDSDTSLFDSGNCSTAGDFTYRADTSPILV